MALFLALFFMAFFFSDSNFLARRFLALSVLAAQFQIKGSQGLASSLGDGGQGSRELTLRGWPMATRIRPGLGS
jgi:hypothetical protein